MACKKTKQQQKIISFSFFQDLLSAACTHQQNCLQRPKAKLSPSALFHLATASLSVSTVHTHTISFREPCVGDWTLKLSKKQPKIISLLFFFLQDLLSAACTHQQNCLQRPKEKLSPSALFHLATASLSFSTVHTPSAFVSCV